MPEERKITARIEKELYDKVQEKFYHGQQTLFFNQLFKSLETIIDENRFDEITDYLYKGKELKLPAIED